MSESGDEHPRATDARAEAAGLTAAATESAKRWGRILGPYGVASPARALLELAATAAGFVLVWWAMYHCLTHELGWLCIPLAIPAGFLLVRLFVIQHDCGHGSFFPSRRANDLLGRVLGVLTLAPYDYWRRTHAIHHATSGNLGKRGIGDIDVLTVAEYLALPRLQRITYRVKRHPLVLLGLGPAYLFLLKYRLPVGLMGEGRKVWIPVLLTNAVIVGFTLAMGSWLGLAAYLTIQIPVTLLAATIGVWLFYVQHQFPETYWAQDESWTFHAGAMQGSTFYDIPNWLHRATGHIGVHHVHHLSSRIPSYELPRVIAEHPELRRIGRLGFRESVRCFRLGLWDERTQRLVGFRGVASAES